MGGLGRLTQETYRHRNILVFRKTIVPPLLPLAMLLLLCVWVSLEPSVVDGRADNAPARGAGITIMLSPLFYLLLIVLNLIDAVFDQSGPTCAWLWSLIVCSAVAGIMSIVLDAPVTMGIGIGLASVLPMSFTRRLLLPGSIGFWQSL